MTPPSALLQYRRVAAVTPDVVPANVDANVQCILHAAQEAWQEGADIIVLPELAITGYTCGDLFTAPVLLHAALAGLESIVAWSASLDHGPLIIVGLPLRLESSVYNAAAVVTSGHVAGIVLKRTLPEGQEYYEQRWFRSGAECTQQHVQLFGRSVPVDTYLVFADSADERCRVGVEICEDLWTVHPVSSSLACAGATIIVNPSASNETIGKAEYRRALVTQQSARTYSAYVYTSAGSGESTTDTVYGGHRLIAECGDLLAQDAPLQTASGRTIADVDLDRILALRMQSTSFRYASAHPIRAVSVTIGHQPLDSIRRLVPRHPFVPADVHERGQRAQDVLRIQTMGLVTRMRRSGASMMVLGLSGGLDSTLALLVCAEACAELQWPTSRILAVAMPGFGTTDRTRSNADTLARVLGAQLRTIPIDQAVLHHFNDIGHDASVHDVTYENSQARERTQILMDLANSVGGLVIGTGDLSELALGWCTYNADQMSMYGVNSGVPKTLVRYVIEQYAKRHHDVHAVLTDILDTPVSPELLPPAADGTIAQQTEAVLGPYEVHDFFLWHLIRNRTRPLNVGILALHAFHGVYAPHDMMRWLETFIRRFFSQQFKRSAMPDGVKIGSVALSPRADWRMPSDASADVWLADCARLRNFL